MTVAESLPRQVGDVVLRELRHRDAEAFARGTDDPAVQEYGHLPLPEYTPEIVREQIDGVIAQGLDDGSLAVLAIADADSDTLLGSLVLFDVRDDRVEVGFWLAPAARGRGVAAKALEAACQVGAATGFDLVDARTSPQNVPSQRALQSAGFRQVGGPIDRETPSGAVVAVVLFERPLGQGTELPRSSTAGRLPGRTSDRR